MARTCGSWFQAKKAGWYTVLADPQMPAMSTVLDHAHNAIDRKLFAMKGFRHPGGSHAAFLTGLAHLHNLIPFSAGPCTRASAGWKWKAGDYPPQTGCSTCKSSLQEAVSCVRLHLPHH